MIKKSVATLLIAISFGAGSRAQNILQSRPYPQNYFQYPLDLPPTTAGSFGELRSNHFHSGLDFKTNQHTGYPVHAAFDGYVSRLRVQFGGFGNAVYITHPNGYVTVYGHLEKFEPGLAQIVRGYQYQQQSFEVDIALQPAQMPVCKGQVFAWSGNAGASAGPHLHFEIRDALTQETINPQLFGLTIADKIPPAITGMYVYYIDGSPFSGNTAKDFFQVAGAAGNYHLLKPGVIMLNGESGFGISAYDVNSTSANHNGVYSIQLNLDGKPVYTFAVERFAFDQTHAINAHIDYPAYVISRKEIQKSFILPGNKISVYPQSVNRGLINLTDDAVHEIEYLVKDIAGNTSVLKFKVQLAGRQPAAVDKPAGTYFKYDQQNQFLNDQVKVLIPAGDLYDNLLFTYSTLPKRPGGYSVVHRIHNRLTPVHDSYELWIKPDNSIGAYASKAVIYNTESGSEGGIYQDGYVKASARSFGDFYIRLDTVPPVIRPINLHEGLNMAGLKAIFFKIGDNLSGIKSYNGKIDGKWVLMEWDYKTKVLSYTFDGTITPGKHSFTLVVVDNKDNTAQFTANFNR